MEIGWTWAQIAKSIGGGMWIEAPKSQSIDQAILELMEPTKEDLQFSFVLG